MSKVHITKDSATENNTTAGVWASNKLGTIGIVAVEGQSPYLCLYGKDLRFPSLAIFTGTDGKAKLQLPGPDGTAKGVRQFNVEDILTAINVVDKVEQAFYPPLANVLGVTE
jgi:hypothetical protein